MYAQSNENTHAFPGAEGFGRYTPGGRGGRIIKVTNLNDRGEGSLRAAVEATGPRIVVFDVSGIIELQSNLNIRNPYLTIAGQTAPGDGICLKNHTLVIFQAHDIVVRFLKMRPGGNGDALSIDYSQNIMIDHCSMGWSTDEIVNIRKENENVTMQWCILSESLNNAGHGYAASLGSRRATFHHNLLANNYGRNPSIGGSEHGLTSPINFTNNVIYNYTSRAIDGKPHGINVINNYYKPGPSTESTVNPNFVLIHDMKADGIEAQNNWYIDGNYNPDYPEVINNNWNYVRFQGGTSENENRALTPFDDGGYKLKTAVEAYEEVLEYVGASVPLLDTIDKRAIHNTRTGTTTVGDGIIDFVSQVGGWPEYKTYNVPADTDGDGMPDEWEIANGLDPDDPSDGNKDRNHDGYTNIEDYLNSLVPSFFDTQPIVSVIHPSMSELFLVQGDTSIYVEAYANDYNGGSISEMELFLNNVLIKGGNDITKLADTIKNIPAGMHYMIIKAKDNTDNITIDTVTVFVGKREVRINIEETQNGRVKLTPAGGLYTENVHVDITAIPNEGYRFQGWIKDIESSRKTISLTTANDVNLKPVFIPDSDINGLYARTIKINFQPEEFLVSGYIKDLGHQYGKNSDDYTFGWIEGNNTNRGTTVHYGVWRHYAQFEYFGDVFSWGIALPKGIYRVRLGLGGTKGFYPVESETELKINVEGTVLEDPDGVDLLDEHILDSVYVTDGQLTLTSVEQSRICFIEIELMESLPDKHLIVNNGSGDGSYLEQDVAVIIADSPAAGEVFDKWSGDTAYLEDIYASTTFVTMPDTNVSITATYRAFSAQEGYYLCVTNGSGTGYYSEGTQVEISAPDTIVGGDFSHWEYDCLRDITINEESRSFNFTTVEANVVFEAVYKMREPKSENDIYQAEDAEIDSKSITERYHGGYYGLGYVNWGANRGSYVQFNNIDGKDGGNFTIKLRYSLNDQTREGVVVINGERDTIIMNSTKSWSEWSEVEVSGTLVPGTNNTIRVETSGDNLGYLDQIEVIDLKTTQFETSRIEPAMNVSCYPNPFKDHTTISFELHQPLDVSIQLYDLQGVKVKEISHNLFPAGLNSVTMYNENLIPGLYILRLSSKQSEKNLKVMIN
jgi:hypothetical protein